MYFLLSIVSICPDGYTSQPGDAVGIQWNSVELPKRSSRNYVTGSTINHLVSSKKCGELCDVTDDCKAIQWSPSELNCVMIKVSNPNGPKYLDYEFCSKSGAQIK